MAASGDADDGNKDVAGSNLSPTRRQFLVGAAGTATLTATGGLTTTATAAGSTKSLESLPADGKPPYGKAQIGIDGYRELAEGERLQQRKGNTLQFSKKVDAVKDLGLDPSGNEPIDPVLNSKIEGGMLVVMPPGTYRAKNEIKPGVEGKYGIVGKGYQKSKQPPKPGKNSVVIKVESGGPITLFNIGPLDSGLFGNFVIDQRKPRPHGGVKIRSSGYVRVRDIRIVGTQTQVTGADDNPGFFVPMAEGNDSLIVYERCIARGGGIPGTKNIGGSYGVGVFGRHGPRGTVVLKDCIIENMADNGIYGARTKATLHVLGGLYRNNDVSQVRANGDASINGADIVIDEKHYSGRKSKSYGRERGPGWPSTNGVKIETKSSISRGTGTPVKNCNIIGNTVADESSVGALVRMWDSAGAVTIDNCRITNNIPSTTSVFAEEPGSGKYPPAPKPWTVTLKNSVVQGKGAGKDGPAVDIRGRPRSQTTNTCFRYSGANKSDIEGTGVSNCGFGRRCKDAGLSAPKKVGDGDNLPKIPIPNNPGRGNQTPVTTPDFSERNPGILDGIANWFEDTVQAFKNTILGFAKMIILVIFGPLVAIALGAILFVGVFFVILLFLAAGLKGLKE